MAYGGAVGWTQCSSEHLVSSVLRRARRCRCVLSVPICGATESDLGIYMIQLDELEVARQDINPSVPHSLRH